MRKLVWIAPWLVVLCTSCAGGGDEVVVPEAVKSADIVREDGGVTSRYFDVDNPYTIERIAEVYEDADVRSTVEGFEDRGYTQEPLRSFVAEGEGPDGKRLEVAALTMSGPSGRNTDVVYVFAIRHGEAEYVVPARLTFADAPIDDDSFAIAEGVWIGLAADPADPGARLAPGQLSWREWFRCVAERIVAGAASCAWTCQFAASLYLHCLIHCTQGYAVYALVSCTIQQL